MVRVYTDVSKRARNSINSQIKKLIKKYGSKEVRLVSAKIFEKEVKQKKLEDEIARREKELINLKRTKQ